MTDNSGRRDKRKDIQQEKERSWERNQTQHACRPNSMDLNDAADMRDEAEQAFNDARKTRGKRDLLYVAVMACVIVMLTGAVCGRKDIIIVSTVIAVAFSCAGSLACYRMKKSLHTYHENNAVLENELDAADYQNIMGCPHPWKTF